MMRHAQGQSVGSNSDPSGPRAEICSYTRLQSRGFPRRLQPKAPPGGKDPAPPFTPKTIMAPICVPSVRRISKVVSRIEARVLSAIACPGLGAGFVIIARARAAYVPFAGLPLTATMSPKIVATKKFFGWAEGVTLGLVAIFDTSETSLCYSTKFSTSIWRMLGAAICPWARRP